MGKEAVNLSVQGEELERRGGGGEIIPESQEAIDAGRDDIRARVNVAETMPEFKPYDEVFVRRSSGKMEAGWMIEGSLGDRVFVSKTDLVTGEVLPKRVTLEYLKNWHKEAVKSGLKKEGLGDWKAARARREEVLKRQEREQVEREATILKFENHDEVFVKRSGGKMEAGWMVESSMGDKVLVSKTDLVTGETITKQVTGVNLRTWHKEATDAGLKKEGLGDWKAARERRAEAKRKERGL